MTGIRDVIVEKIIRLFERMTSRNIYLDDQEVVSMFSKEQINKNIERIRSKQVRTVAFFCMNVSMWKYQSLFEELQRNESYKPVIFIAPRKGPWHNRKKDISEMTALCKKMKYEFVPLKNDFLNIGQNLDSYEIDYAFFTQPYPNLLCKEYSFEKLRNALLCYVPYAFCIVNEHFNYDSQLIRIAWKNFYPTKDCLIESKNFNQKTDNMHITGYPGYDMYERVPSLEWKDNKRKRVIWAPHHSIEEKGWLHLSCFMQVHDYMIELAHKYEEQILIAFKPHPHLFSSLCNIWGKERTMNYFSQWRTMKNGMLCESGNYSLFKSSDAMIHDSGSFIMEYLYTGKPCMYLLLHGDNKVELNDSGKSALNAHYLAHTKADIEDFICNVVIDGRDSKLEERENVFKTRVLPDNGKTATQNIITEMEQI